MKKRIEDYEPSIFSIKVDLTHDRTSYVMPLDSLEDELLKLNLLQPFITGDMEDAVKEGIQAAKGEGGRISAQSIIVDKITENPAGMMIFAGYGNLCHYAKVGLVWDDPNYELETELPSTPAQMKPEDWFNFAVAVEGECRSKAGRRLFCGADLTAMVSAASGSDDEDIEAEKNE